MPSYGPPATYWPHDFGQVPCIFWALVSSSVRWVMYPAFWGCKCCKGSSSPPHRPQSSNDPRVLVSLDYALFTGQSVDIRDVVWLGDTKHPACTHSAGGPPPRGPPQSSGMEEKTGALRRSQKELTDGQSQRVPWRRSPSFYRWGN